MYILSTVQTPFTNPEDKLQSITIMATEPPSLPSVNPLLNTNGCPIYVPAASVDAYKAATNWANLASRIQAIPA